MGSLWGVGKNIIIATNFNNDGNIFIFDRKGKALKRINRKGQGNEEYSSYSRIILDEEKEEIFVNNSFAKKIQVYDLEGNFKRDLLIKKEFSLFEMYNFDKDNLIAMMISRGIPDSHSCSYPSRTAASPEKSQFLLMRRKASMSGSKIKR